MYCKFVYISKAKGNVKEIKEEYNPEKEKLWKGIIRDCTKYYTKVIFIYNRVPYVLVVVSL